MDITNEEFVETYLGLKVQAHNGIRDVYTATEPVANDVDWRSKGAVN